MLDSLRKTELGVRRSRETWFGRIASIFNREALGDEVWEELEELLVSADVGVETTNRLLSKVRQRVKTDRLSEVPQIRETLKEEMINLLTAPSSAVAVSHGPTFVYSESLASSNSKAVLSGHSEPSAQPDFIQDSLRKEPHGTPGRIRKGEESAQVILVVGVNGSGKTTSIAKLAHGFTSQGKQVILAAADTFRAAAGEQLKHWGKKTGAEVIAHQPGGDPGAVAYDAVQAAYNRGAHAVIIDTAGRLHTRFNLMEELKKMKRVVAKHDASAPHQVLLVMDATTGQNGLAQAKYFTAAVDVTSVFLAKLDGTAKGGIVFAICDQLNIPVSYIGTGEGLQDMTPFDAEVFVDAILS
jgi:fused signal recognition particle receptor